MFLLEIAAVVALILWGIGCVAVERYALGLISIGVLLVGGWFVFGPVKDFVAHVGWQSLVFKWLPAYLVAGILIALVKWMFYVWRTADDIRDSRDSFKNRTVAGSENVARRRQEFIKHYMQENGKTYRDPDYINAEQIADHRFLEEGIVAELLTPRPMNHVGRISFWILEWPYVIVAMIVDDFFIRFARNVVRVFDIAFTQMTRFWISRVVKDI